MQRIIFALLILLLNQRPCGAQEKLPADSVKSLSGVVITAFEQNRNISCGAIVRVIHDNTIDRHNKTSFVHAFNTVPGVRMEERSPGSFRINIRGSALRSPFGVRNVKVYWNNIPVTDPGGNTYFNQFAFNNFQYAEIIKGPAGSMYGAGTGGALLMHAFENSWQPGVKLDYVTGSYGLHTILFSAGFGKKDNRSLLTFSHNQSEGYRNHTNNRRDNFSLSTQYKVSGKQILSASILYSNLFYETPGGLNNAEFIDNPRMARPATGSLPSAAAAKAAIYQTNFLAGITQQLNFTTAFKNTSTIYGSFAQVNNPTFRNYERRSEPGFGARTTFTYEQPLKETKIKWVWGGEWQRGFFSTVVSKNKNGNPDTLFTDDDTRLDVYSFFAQAAISLEDEWFITAGLSMNKSSVGVTRLNRYPVQQQRRNYNNEWSPRVAVQKKFSNVAEVFASISRGFSPPTMAELLPSTGVISTFLEAESGANYEFGGRLFLLKNKLRIDATAFYLKLNNALVLRKDSSNADYFVNAGNTSQKGLEMSADFLSIFKSNFFDYMSIKTAYAYSLFTYGNYQKGTADLSGKTLPGVPQHTISILTDLYLKNGLYCNSTGYFASRVFINDDNTAVGDGYFLLGCRAGWKRKIRSGQAINVHAGIDNLLNQNYSSGFDINAAGGRYYNAAPKRNYYLGISFEWPVKNKASTAQ